MQIIWDYNAIEVGDLIVDHERNAVGIVIEKQDQIVNVLPPSGQTDKQTVWVIIWTDSKSRLPYIKRVLKEMNVSHIKL